MNTVSPVESIYNRGLIVIDGIFCRVNAPNQAKALGNSRDIVGSINRCNLGGNTAKFRTWVITLFNNRCESHSHVQLQVTRNLILS